MRERLLTFPSVRSYEHEYPDEQRAGGRRVGLPWAESILEYIADASTSRKAMTSDRATGSLSAKSCSTPTSGICFGCCARVASGKATDSPSSPATNSRRLICCPRAEDRALGARGDIFDSKIRPLWRAVAAQE
jgi:hypothetical protein